MTTGFFKTAGQAENQWTRVVGTVKVANPLAGTDYQLVAAEDAQTIISIAPNLAPTGAATAQVSGRVVTVTATSTDTVQPQMTIEATGGSVAQVSPGLWTITVPSSGVLTEGTWTVTFSNGVLPNATASGSFSIPADLVSASVTMSFAQAGYTAGQVISLASLIATVTVPGSPPLSASSVTRTLLVNGQPTAFPHTLSANQQIIARGIYVDQVTGQTVIVDSDPITVQAVPPQIVGATITDNGNSTYTLDVDFSQAAQAGETVYIALHADNSGDPAPNALQIWDGTGALIFGRQAFVIGAGPVAFPLSGAGAGNFEVRLVASYENTGNNLSGIFALPAPVAFSVGTPAPDEITVTVLTGAIDVLPRAAVLTTAPGAALFQFGSAEMVLPLDAGSYQRINPDTGVVTDFTIVGPTPVIEPANPTVATPLTVGGSLAPNTTYNWLLNGASFDPIQTGPTLPAPQTLGVPAGATIGLQTNLGRPNFVPAAPVILGAAGYLEEFNGTNGAALVGFTARTGAVTATYQDGAARLAAISGTTLQDRFNTLQPNGVTAQSGRVFVETVLGPNNAEGDNVIGFRDPVSGRSYVCRVRVGQNQFNFARLANDSSGTAITTGIDLTIHFNPGLTLWAVGDTCRIEMEVVGASTRLIGYRQGAQMTNDTGLTPRTATDTSADRITAAVAPIFGHRSGAVAPDSTRRADHRSLAFGVV